MSFGCILLVSAGLLHGSVRSSVSASSLNIWIGLFYMFVGLYTAAMVEITELHSITESDFLVGMTQKKREEKMFNFQHFHLLNVSITLSAK